MAATIHAGVRLIRPVARVFARLRRRIAAVFVGITGFSGRIWGLWRAKKRKLVSDLLELGALVVAVFAGFEIGRLAGLLALAGALYAYSLLMDPPRPRARARRREAAK